MKQGQDGQHENADLNDSHGPAILARRKTKNEFKRGGHEDAATPQAEHIKHRQRQQRQSIGGFARAHEGYRQTKQCEPEILRVFALRHVERKAKHRHTEKE